MHWPARQPSAADLPAGFCRCGYDHAVFIAFDGDEIGLIELHALHVAEEGGIFDENIVTGIDECLAKQIHGLGGAGDRQDGGNVAFQHVTDILQQAFDKGRIAFGGPVLQQHLALFAENLIRDDTDRIVGQGRRGRIAAGKGDHPGLGDDLENLTDRAAGNLIKTMGESEL